ncbi:MAG: PASTA domain-containing protein, partial [Ornithinibacter sp.]
GVATRPRSETVAITVPPPPIEGRVVAGTEPRRRRRWWPAVAASALVAALTGWFFLLGPGATATVPSVQGRTQSEAVSAVHQAALDATVSQAFSETVPAGVVVSADPRPGNTMRRGAAVALVVSKGPERYAVPPVVGMTLAEARARIKAVNLAVGKVSKAYDEKVPEGQVVTAKPRPGASLKKSTAVALTVSRGRHPIDVPDLTGKDGIRAARQLSGLGLQVDATQQQNSDTVAKGAVISQSPRDGTAFRGDTVTLVVSKGPVLVPVPDVVGQQLQQARATLQAAGFKVTVEKAFGGFFGTVRFQDPAGGEAPKGSTVTVTIV